MITSLLNNINKIHAITEAAQTALSDSFEVIEVPKRHMLLREGETCNYLYLLINGLARMYYIKEDEEVCSLFFFEENHMFHVPNSFYSRKPGYQFVETLEPSVIARIHYDKLQQLYQKYPELNFIGRVITENYFVKSEERLYLLRKQTAEERYLYITEKYPIVLQKVPLKYIASYLGITLETLSRIRNKIRK